MQQTANGNEAMQGAMGAPPGDCGCGDAGQQPAGAMGGGYAPSPGQTGQTGPAEQPGQTGQTGPMGQTVPTGQSQGMTGAAGEDHACGCGEETDEGEQARHAWGQAPPYGEQAANPGAASSPQGPSPGQMYGGGCNQEGGPQGMAGAPYQNPGYMQGGPQPPNMGHPPHPGQQPGPQPGAMPHMGFQPPPGYQPGPQPGQMPHGGYQPPPGYQPGQGHNPHMCGHDTSHGPGHPKHDAHQYGQFMGLVNDIANGKADPSKVMSFLSGIDGQFWKGALVGVGVTMLLTNDTVKSTLMSALAGAMGTFTKETEEKTE